MCKVGPFRLTSAPWPEPRRETTMMRGAVPAAGPFARHSLTSSLTRPLPHHSPSFHPPFRRRRGGERWVSGVEGM